MSVEIEVIVKYEDFMRLENLWNNILEKSHSDYVSLTFEWLKSWWLGFGRNREMLIILVKKDKSIIGIAPLMIGYSRLRGLPVREISFMGDDNSPRFDFILSEQRTEAIDATVKYLKNIDRHWDIMHFANIPNDSLNYEIFRQTLINNKMLFYEKEGLNSPYLEIRTAWGPYFSALSKNFRKALRKDKNRMERLGQYTIEKIENLNYSKDTLTKVFDISKNSWKAKYNKEITSTHENRQFFEELSKVSSRKGWLNIWLLNIKDESIAYEYHLKYKNKMYGLRADFDEKYEYASPGSVLHAHVIRDIFENILTEYDMGGSNDSYKRNWTSSIRNHARFVVYKPSLYGISLYILESKIISYLKKFKFSAGVKNSMIKNKGKRSEL